MGLKPRVLIFIDWFLPGYKAGGPIKSVANIVRSLQHEIDFSIVTSNADFGESETYSNITPNVWLHQNGYRVIYLDAQQQNFSFVKQLITEEDYSYIYLNSLFSYKFTLYPLLAHKSKKLDSKIVLAPRGMLGEGALNLKKKKKKLFLRISRLLGLYKEVTWHASTQHEAAEIKSAFGDLAKVTIASNIATLAYTLENTIVKTSDNTNFFFLSRISPKKNLLGALHFLAAVPLKKKVNFHIIGPVEDEAYWKQCQLQIMNLPENIQVNYMGAIPNPELPAILEKYHFLLLPTFSENYGHVVVEAWSSGCPVILSDQTPWRNLEKAKVGWELPLNNEAEFVKILQHCIQMGDEEFQYMRSKTQDYLKKKVITVEILEQNRKLFS